METVSRTSAEELAAYSAGHFARVSAQAAIRLGPLFPEQPPFVLSRGSTERPTDLALGKWAISDPLLSFHR
jgi:hypothetical protein